VPDEGELPDEEDTSHKQIEYHFNPLRAKKEFDAGMFYFHQGDFRGYRAAAPRFLEATRWNPGWAEAYLKLGEAEARLKHDDEARKALAKVLELDPKSKEAKEAKKLNAKLQKDTPKH
jgi:TolA-binding protein